MQEVEAICNRVVIIDRGKIVADDSTKNLSSIIGHGLRFKVEFKETINKAKLAHMDFVHSIEQQDDNICIITSKNNEDIREDIFKFAVDNNYKVLSLSQMESSMEDIFHKLTKD